MRIIKTWRENTDEGISYLKYNNYGSKIIRLTKEIFLCIGKEKPMLCDDVKIIYEI